MPSGTGHHCFGNSEFSVTVTLINLISFYSEETVIPVITQDIDNKS